MSTISEIHISSSFPKKYLIGILKYIKDHSPEELKNIHFTLSRAISHMVFLFGEEYQITKLNH